jgi:AcrR family transcriptional regulator
MPFARFANMPEDKRERLLNSAAREFAACGFEGASLNRILETAHIGKSSAYYYFADKADLFATTAAYCVERLGLALSPAVITDLTAETFWPSLTEAHIEPLLHAQQHPWLLGAARAVEHLTPESLQHEALGQLASQLMAGMSTVIQRGQELGLIRTDLPQTLLVAWYRAVDGASDDWLLVHLTELDAEAIRQIAQQTMVGIQRALAPPP